MIEIYSAPDLEKAERQQRRILIWMIVLSVLFITGIVVSFIERIQWLTIALTILWLGMLVFLWDLKLSPIRAYLRFLQGMMGDTQREMQGVVTLLENERSLRDGVEYYRLLLNVDPAMEPEGERQLFFDANKPLPDLLAGQSVRLLYFGNDVRAYEVLAEGAAT